MDLRTFLKWFAIHLCYSFSTKIVASLPTAEVEPIRSNYSQCWKVVEDFLLSVSMFKVCPLILYRLGTKLTRAEVADKVKYFFKYYSIPSIDGQRRLAQVVRLTLEKKHHHHHLRLNPKQVDVNYVGFYSYVIHPKRQHKRNGCCSNWLGRLKGSRFILSSTCS
uniref:Uncharacterized protein n=1 Tax=Solanum lycopersicum TaxID=4081 RepID=Q0KIH7_SOLLC|nr:hypothetical protein LES1_20t00003 [Solanum lycopersicum]